MPIRTVDTDVLAAKTGNLYESVAVMSQRARQLSREVKTELDSQLAYFEDYSVENVDEIRSNEDQLRISLDYERRPKATEQAINEMLADETYFRNPNVETEQQ
jgi:DNA-directed RNA polymerase subunit K/omega